jgi:outer membrane protein TolC
MPDSSALNLRGEFLLSPISFSADSLTSVALHQRTEYLAAQAEEMTSKLQYRSAQLTDRPVLNVNASYGLKNGFIPNLDILRGNWVAGVQLQVPLYEGGLTGYKEQEAQATMNESNAHVIDVEQQIAAEVRQTISDLHASQNKLETAVLQVQEAAEALSIAQKRFDAGAVSNLDVLDAETALSQAHLLRLRSLYEFVTSRYALDRAVGTPIWK